MTLITLKSTSRYSVLLMAAWFLTGCALSPDIGMGGEAVRPSLPKQWQNQISTSDDKIKTAVSTDWWQGFGNPELNQLVATASIQSYDLISAVARVTQAEAQSRVSASGLWPTLSASFGSSRTGLLKESGYSNKSHSLGLKASYELDFWGRNRAQNLSGRAALRGSQFDRDTVRLTLVSNVATQWLEAVGLRERLTISQRNLNNAERVLAFIEARARSGAATELELAQQRGLLANQQRSLAVLQQQVEDSKTTLAILLGQMDVVFSTQSLAGVTAPTMPSAGLPIDLLVHRPDIASAEAALAAADADIIVARAALLPQLSLSAGVNSDSTVFRNLTEAPLYNLAANLSAPIFNGGRLRAQRDVIIASREILLASYRRTIVNAFGEVEKALNSIAGLDAQIIAQTEQLKQTRRAFRLSETRYRAGADTLLTLLGSQKSLYNAEDSSAQLRQQHLQACVNLYRALGGGWISPEIP